MELLGPVIDIHQKQVVQQQILYKIISVKPLLVGCNQALKLAYRHLPHHIYVLSRSPDNQHILRDFFIINLKKMIPLHLLAICHGLSELANRVNGDSLQLPGGCHLIALQIQHAEIYFCNASQFLDGIFYHLSRNHVFPPVVDYMIVINQSIFAFALDKNNMFRSKL